MNILDSHFVANPDNALIDTTAFECEVKKILDRVTSTASPWEAIFELYDKLVSEKPPEPNDDQLICRYFAPTKFLWFVAQKTLHFSPANQFEDVRDSLMHEDYYNAVLCVLTERRLEAIEWDKYLRDQQRRWLVSCWTRIEDPFDDILLWNSYAEGPMGVGVTVRYGVLRDKLKTFARDPRLEEPLYGNVAYGQPLLIAPFSKRQFFRNESEVRFAFRSNGPANFRLNLAPVWGQLGLRLSPEAPQWHVNAIETVWKKFEGGDEIHVAGG